MPRLPRLTANFWRRFHATMTLLWVAALVPSLLWWSQSIPWLVFMSVWANVAGHASAWQGSRAEAANTDDTGSVAQLTDGDQGPDQRD